VPPFEVLVVDDSFACCRSALAWAKRRVVTHGCEKSVAKEEMYFSTERCCEPKDLPTIMQCRKRRTATLIDPLGFGHSPERHRTLAWIVTEDGGQTSSDRDHGS
jgi:hypothetical protein